MNQVQNRPFDTSGWILENREKFTKRGGSSTKNFKEVSSIVTQHFSKYFEREKDTRKQQERLEMQHRAIIGEETAKNFFLTEIEEFLREQNLLNAEFPSYSDSLVEGLFQDIYGWGPLVQFFNKENCETAIISGCELWLEIDGYPQRQKEGFESIERVEELIRALTMRDPQATINEQSPELELEMEDGTRVAMVIPPRGRYHYIEFRKFVVKTHTLETHARKNTIHPDDIPFFRALARTHPNTVFAGQVKSAKTTMLKTFYGERDPRYVAAVTEQHFEVALKRDFPERLVFELQANEAQLHKATRRILRFFHDFILVPEVRSIEAEAAMMSCEKGVRGNMMSYHNTDVENIPEELARFILNEFPNRNFENEVLRVGKNIDIVITMKAMRNRSIKKVTSVTEIRREGRKVTSHLLMKWNKEKDQWLYNNDISSRLAELMSDIDIDQTRVLINFLEGKSKSQAIQGPTVFNCLE